MRGFSASQRAPERPYGGLLCPGCVDALVRYVTRMEVRHMKPGFEDLDLARDLTIEKFLPRGWWATVSSGKKLPKKTPYKPKAKAEASAKQNAEKPKISRRRKAE